MFGRFFSAGTPLAVAVLGIGLFFAVPAVADDVDFANAEGVGASDAELAFPEILSSEDAGLYGRIFDVQEQGDWKQADRLIGRLEKRVLRWR